MRKLLLVAVALVALTESSARAVEFSDPTHAVNPAVPAVRTDGQVESTDKVGSCVAVRPENGRVPKPLASLPVVAPVAK